MSDRDKLIEAANEVAQVANALNPKDPPTNIAHLRERLWGAAETLSTYLGRPPNAEWPIREATASGDLDWHSIQMPGGRP